MIGSKKQIIFFDGYCHMCSWAVSLVLPRDPKGITHFLPLQSPDTKDFFIKHHYQIESDSIILYKAGRFYSESDAILMIFASMQGLWPVLSILGVLPKKWMDGMYRFIARNRFRLISQQAVCTMAPRRYRRRFQLPAHGSI
jgi:predicted DCC family thiol-disulfide oxidoreductase YuxK